VIRTLRQAVSRTIEPSGVVGEPRSLLPLPGEGIRVRASDPGKKPLTL
jgi:hypothetical protein